MKINSPFRLTPLWRKIQRYLVKIQRWKSNGGNPTVENPTVKIQRYFLKVKNL